MRVLMLAHGEPPSPTTAQNLAARHDAVIAVDGAIHRAQELGLTPNVLTGDFDSVRLDFVTALYPHIRVIATPDQEQSDLEKAVTVAANLGATSVTVIGAAGGRLDHTLANVALLLRSPVPVCLVDDFGSLQAISSAPRSANSVTIETSMGDTVSLVTFDFETYVTISGVLWPLEASHLLPGTRGVSNVATGAEVTVSVNTGSVFVSHLYVEQVRKHSELP